MAHTVLIADDHDVIREGIKSIISKQADYKVVGEASDGEEALKQVEKLRPDVLLMDITMPKRSGLDILSQVHHVSPKTRIIIITVHRANIYINKAFKLGVKGYLHKDNVVEDLLPALRRVIRNEIYVSPQVSKFLVGQLDRAGEPDDKKTGELNEREADVLRLVAEGKTAKEIADVLFLSPRTVENYKNVLLDKLGLHKTADLIKYAIKHNIIEVEE